MKKILLIGWKDLTLAFRDRAALILMLAAPFVLTLGMGVVTGRFSGGGGGGLSDIPVIIVDQDGGQLGDALVDLFQSPDLADLLETTLLDDPITARQQVDEDQVAALIVVPPGFSASIIPAPEAPSSGDVVRIELYTNPARPTSSGVVKTILEDFLSRVEVGRIGGEVTITQMLADGLIQPQEAQAIALEMGAHQAAGGEVEAPITLSRISAGEEPVEFDVLALLAPGMALMFLMYTVGYGGRSLLDERDQGTLPRLLVSPTTTIQALGGKTLGVYLTGVAQMLILIGGTALLFQLNWGAPAAVLALILAAVFAAVGWGMIITALARTPGQISVAGSVIMLSFGILGGGFFSTEFMPGWFQALRSITPNAWGLDGFTTLALGGSLAEIGDSLLALLLMGALLFGLAVVIFTRRGFERG